MGKFQKQLKTLKGYKHQLLAGAADGGNPDQAQWQKWADECSKAVTAADEHETKVETLMATISQTQSVGKDKAVYEKLKEEAVAMFSTAEHMLEGIQLSNTRFKKYVS